MEDLTSKLKAGLRGLFSTGTSKPANQHDWEKKGQGRRLGSANEDSGSGQASLPQHRAAGPAGAGSGQGSRSTPSATSSLRVQVTTPPQPLDASLAGRSASSLYVAGSGTNLDSISGPVEERPLPVPRANRHMAGADAVQDAVLASVVMASTPTGAECVGLGPHLALRAAHAGPSSDSPELLRGQAGSLNTPTAAERTMGLGGNWQPESEQDFHLQQCLALVVSEDEHVSGPCLVTMHKILRNILTNPTQPKYRTIRLSNPAVQSSIVAVQGALEFLDAIGFLTTFQPASTTTSPSQPLTAHHHIPPSPAASPGASHEPDPTDKAAVAGATMTSTPSAAVSADGLNTNALLLTVSDLPTTPGPATGSTQRLGMGSPGTASDNSAVSRPSLGSFGPGYHAAGQGGDGTREPGSAVRVVQRCISGGCTRLQRRVSEGSMRRVSGGSSSIVGAVGEEQGAGGVGKCSPLNSMTSRHSSDEQLEAFLVLPPDARLHALSLGLHELSMVMQAMDLEVPPPPPPPPLRQDSSPPPTALSPAGPSKLQVQPGAGPPSPGTTSPTKAPSRLSVAIPTSPSPLSTGTSAAVASSSHLPPPQHQRIVVRNTQVVLPVVPDTSVPDWFYERTGAELKAEVASLARRRAAGEVLVTRAWRERLAVSGQASTSASAASQSLLLRVRFPEGVCLQGCFGGSEPAADVFSWVTESLRDPGLSYELIGPSRKPLKAAGNLRAAQDLWPAAVLNFRPLGTELAMYNTLPYLNDELLANTLAE